jgi:hypothetical protein
MTEFGLVANALLTKTVILRESGVSSTSGEGDVLSLRGMPANGIRCCTPTQTRAS